MDEIRLDKAQRARAVALESRVIDDPDWACSAIVWQRDQLADRDAEIERLRARVDVLLPYKPGVETWKARHDAAQEEIERLRADLVWAVKRDARHRLAKWPHQDDEQGTLEWKTDSSWSSRYAQVDNTPDSICRAVREARTNGR